jgi:dethiobiotin synthetase
VAVRVGTVVVCDAAVGGVHAAVAVTEALRRRTLDLLGTVLATRPAEHDVAGAYLAATLEGATGLPLLGSIREGAGGWEPSVFADRAGAWLPIR